MLLKLYSYICFAKKEAWTPLSIFLKRIHNCMSNLERLQQKTKKSNIEFIIKSNYIYIADLLEKNPTHN